MKKLNVKKIIVPSIYLVAVLSVMGCVALTISGINKYFTKTKDFNYSVNGLIDSKVKPVQGEDNKECQGDTCNTIIRPYKSESVKIGRYFYDFEAEAKNQESAIIFYEDTYMQNSGVDYISDTAFDVFSVLGGKVLSVEDDEVLGNIVKIEHEKEIVTVYQGISDVNLKVGDVVKQGDVVGKSGTSQINSKYATSLHFEVYYKGTLMDPENFYKLNLKDL